MGDKHARSEGKKRGNGEGSISWRPKEGRWEGRYVVQTAQGPKRRSVYSKDWEVCRRKLTRAIADRDEGLIFDGEDLTVAEFLGRWLKGPAKKKVRASTYARYEQLARLHLIPALGRHKLKKLTALHLEELYDLKLEEGLSPRTVNYIHVTMSKALRYGVGKDLLRRSVAFFAEAPQPDEPEIRPLDATQAASFLETARDNRLYALFVLALSKGLRRSEMLGFVEDDLTLDAPTPTLQVRRGLTIAPGGGVAVEKTKRKSSQRLLELSPETVAALRAHRALKAREQLAAGPGRWQNNAAEYGLPGEWLFTNRFGSFVHPNNLYTAYFKPLRDRAGLPDLHFHDLRHTYATLALLNGVPVKVVSETLGHKDIATTLRTYAHVIPGMQGEAGKTMDGVLF
jgi:integrase